jgi:MATE family multidrug resistance protein
MTSQLRTAARTEAKTLFQLAVPIIIGLGAAMLQGLIDTVMIAPLGTTSLAAVSLTTSAAIVMYSALYGLITIVGIQIAQAHGGGDTHKATQAIRTGWTMALIAGLIGTVAMLALIFTLGPLGQPPEVLAILAPYWVPIALSLVPFTLLFTLKSLFESTDRAWLAAGFAYLGVAANIPLNLILIYGAFGWEGLGLMGGGLATLLSQIIAYAAAHLYWAFAPSMQAYRGPSPVRFSVLKTQFKGGLPVAIGYHHRPVWRDGTGLYADCRRRRGPCLYAALGDGDRRVDPRWPSHWTGRAFASACHRRRRWRYCCAVDAGGDCRPDPRRPAPCAPAI